MKDLGAEIEDFQELETLAVIEDEEKPAMPPPGGRGEI